MKRQRLYTFILSVFAGASMLVAQEKVTFGPVVGYINGSEFFSFNNNDTTEATNGFFIGVFADIPLSEKTHFQPEFSFASFEGSVGSTINPNAMFKFYLGESGLNLQFGPQLTVFLDDVPEDFTSLGIDLGVGLGYDITEIFFMRARYFYQINNSYTGEDLGDFDIKNRVNFLSVGLGYKF